MCLCTPRGAVNLCSIVWLVERAGPMSGAGRGEPVLELQVSKQVAGDRVPGKRPNLGLIFFFPKQLVYKPVRATGSWNLVIRFKVGRRWCWGQAQDLAAQGRITSTPFTESLLRA